jgi:Flp pilus assembly pilin Flp
MTVLSLYRRLMKCEGGATALEYMLIVALVGLIALQVSVKLASAPEM